jgi:hypothetical protein
VFGSGIRRLDGEAVGGRRLSGRGIPYPLGAGQKERPEYPEKSLPVNNS